MWKKSRLILLSSALVFSLIFSPISFVVLAEDEPEEVEDETEESAPEAVEDDEKSEIPQNVIQNYVKVKFENKILFHEQVPSKTIIQVLNGSDEVIESEVLSSDMEMELEAPKIEKGNMLSYWSIEQEKGKMIIKPILIEEKELLVNFLTTEGGELLENNAQTKEIAKSVNKGTNLKDILPEVNPKKHYKFTGWFEYVITEDGEEIEEKLENIEDIKITDSEGEYFAKFYPDFNDNGIDDRTEEVTVKFVTNTDKKIEDVKTNIGNHIKLPTLEKKDSVFMGWFTDSEYQNKFTNDPLQESITLYAKWENADKIIEESETKPITDKDISDQIEKILNERLQGLNANNASGGSNQNNNAAQTSSNPPKNPPKNSVVNDTSSSGNQDNGLQVLSEPNQSSNANQINTFTEKQYVFANKNIGERYMVKFFDENESFLFSLALPYGKTIKTLDENEQLHSEYAVRQDTTITLNVNDFVNADSTLLGFDTREVRVNSMQITEVFPQVKSAVSENLAYERQQALELKNQEMRKWNTIKFSLIGLVIAGVIGALAYLFMRRKRQAQEVI